MSKDVVDVVGEALGHAARDAVKNLSANARKHGRARMSGLTGLAAGAGLATVTPMLGRGASKLVRNVVANGADPLRQAGGKMSQALSNATPGGGDKAQGVPGVGKGRRMPIQQDIDIGVPLKTVYNEWTQFEDWPKFMHRVQQVAQEDNTHVTFKAKVWGISKTFKAEIVEQRPDERIKWRVTDGLVHSGVVTFHELGPRLTRVELTLDVEPGGMLEKAARGMRHIKRAVRGDLARFKAYVLMEEEESGAWRGQIEDGKVKARRSSSGGRRSTSNRSRSTASRSRSGSTSARSTARSGSRRSGSTQSRGSSNGRSSSSKSGGGARARSRRSGSRS